MSRTSDESKISECTQSTCPMKCGTERDESLVPPVHPKSTSRRNTSVYRGRGVVNRKIRKGATDIPKQGIALRLRPRIPDWIDCCINIWGNLLDYKHNAYFLYPVDIKQYPTYPNIVSSSMDLFTIGYKLEDTRRAFKTALQSNTSLNSDIESISTERVSKIYTSAKEFLDDLYLIISNSIKFNIYPDTQVFCDTILMANWIKKRALPRLSRYINYSEYYQRFTRICSRNTRSKRMDNEDSSISRIKGRRLQIVALNSTDGSAKQDESSSSKTLEYFSTTSENTSGSSGSFMDFKIPFE